MSRKGGGLVVCGLGAASGATLTVAAVQALWECDLVITDISDPVVLKWLGALLGPKPIAAVGSAEFAKDWARINARIVRGGRVGLATSGHPLNFGAFARRVLEQARGAGVDCRLTAAVSALEAALALTREVLGITLAAAQVRESTDAAPLPWTDSLNPRMALVLLLGKGFDAMLWARWLSDLGQVYPAGHEGLLYSRQGNWWNAEPKRGGVAELSSLPLGLIEDGLLIFPAATVR